MYKGIIFVLIGFVLFVACSEKTEPAIYDIIPMPVELVEGSGYFMFSDDVSIYISDSSLYDVSQDFVEELSPYIKAEISNHSESPISMKLNDSWKNKERYSVLVNDDAILIEGASTLR